VFELGVEGAGGTAVWADVPFLEAHLEVGKRQGLDGEVADLDRGPDFRGIAQGRESVDAVPGLTGEQRGARLGKERVV
jgi:hypothetical protein